MPVVSRVPLTKHRASLFVPFTLMVLANVIFAFNDVWLRRIADDIGLVETVWARSALFLVLVSLTMTRRDWRAAVEVNRPELQIVRGVFPVVGAFLMIGAMGQIPVADATATFYMTPLIAVVLAIPLLRERIGPEVWIAVVLGITGMLVIVRPGSGMVHWAHGLALLAAFVVALYQIFTAFVTRHTGAKMTLLYMALTATVITSCIVPFVWQPPRLVDWAGLFGTSVLYAVGHGMYIKAHARCDASKLAPFMYSQLLGSISAGYLFYRQVPSAATVVGGILIAAGGCIVLIQHRRANVAV